jgi:hypothetical protein
MGARFVDYIVADRWTLRPEAAAWWVPCAPERARTRFSAETRHPVGVEDAALRAFPPSPPFAPCRGADAEWDANKGTGRRWR